MDYIYNGEVQIFQENLDRFLNVAQRLKLEGLMGNAEEDCQQNNSSETKISKEEHTQSSYDETIHQNHQISKPRQVTKSDRVVVPVSSESSTEVENTVNQHLEKVSSGVYQCKLCGKTAKQSTDLKKHIETHFEGLSYSCQLCGKIFRSKNSRSNHISRCVSQENSWT